MKLPIGTIVKMTAYCKRPSDKTHRSWKTRGIVIGTFARGRMAKIVPVDSEYMKCCEQCPGEARLWRKQPWVYRSWNEIKSI